MIDWLQRPFPLVENFYDKLRLSLFFGLAIFLFLLTYQPFDIDEIVAYKLPFLLGLFLITFSFMMLNLLLAPLLLPQFFQADNWTAGKNILFILWISLNIAITNWAYSLWWHYYCPSCFSSAAHEPYSLPYFVFITLSVGLFPIIFYMLLAERFLSRQHHKVASQMTQQLKERNSSPKEPARLVQINSENQKEEALEISLENLYCISAEGNYIKVYYDSANERVAQRLLRNSLANIEKDLAEFEKITRCHRSYIVNLDQVQEVKGNARNYCLQIPALDFEIPVSRNFPRKLLENLPQSKDF